ncbi:serine hydrolase [Streptomyces sp. NPDC090442]|uniref:serine hydrolase n=1 Tax=Streptomyces sp. NPDC090442 TaxID=3365962 RepID=UPI0038214CE3
MDNYDPELNRNRPHDPRDTTTPRAIAADYRELTVGDALAADRRALFEDWLRRNTTGAGRIRAGLPRSWTVANKTGTGDYGRANDIAVVRPPHTAPLVLALMSHRVGYSTPPSDALLAAATRHVVNTLA